MIAKAREVLIDQQQAMNGQQNKYGRQRIRVDLNTVPPEPIGEGDRKEAEVRQGEANTEPDRQKIEYAQGAQAGDDVDDLCRNDGVTKVAGTNKYVRQITNLSSTIVYPTR